jgi:hypothetical protein
VFAPDDVELIEDPGWPKRRRVASPVITLLDHHPNDDLDRLPASESAQEAGDAESGPRSWRSLRAGL